MGIWYVYRASANPLELLQRFLRSGVYNSSERRGE
jgi:hypothetical protein